MQFHLANHKFMPLNSLLVTDIVKTKGILVSPFKENKILIVHHSNVIHVITKVYVSYNKVILKVPKFNL